MARRQCGFSVVELEPIVLSFFVQALAELIEATAELQTYLGVSRLGDGSPELHVL